MVFWIFLPFRSPNPSPAHVMPQLLFDLSEIDLSQTIFGPEAIRQHNPQRGAMEHLNGIIWANREHDRIVGYKDVRDDEFWVPGHIPGRPLLPGVIMIEAGAQLSSFYTKEFLGWTGFIGFGGVTDVKFRQQVAPGCRMHLLSVKIWERHRRICSQVQGVVDGTLVFEATVTGLQL
jgi:3-hydroxyacyl-[acyl-carrier-protein] dehydratase